MVSNEIVSLRNKNYKKKRRKFHKNVNYLSRQYKPRNRNIRKQNGSVLTEEVHTIESWKKYFQVDQNTASTANCGNENPDLPDKISKNRHMKKHL